MPSLIRPLWKLLVETAVPNTAAPLTCADCFTILEYLADIGSDYGDWPAFIKKARQHLAACPDCQTYFQERLTELEALEEMS